MSFSSLHLTWPDKALFTLPHTEPITIPAPAPARSSLWSPIYSIPPNIYNAALDARVPITIACLYLVTVKTLNSYNKRNGNKAWPISKTTGFFIFVVLHNIFLALYSGWTFLGMYGALRRTIANPMGPTGLLGTVDSLCKMHGNSGLGQAVTFDPNSSAWISQAPETVILGSSGTPSVTDIGRLWNEGLAFYGWFFYLSKFYEVLDTAIILAKGKRSPTLQTYHHAGAMMCMWSGIRYMSTPIWMFCFVNSFIHTLMYTYYTLAALSIRVPTPVKRSLTTMQILQFIVGANYAALHSFVSYDVPIQTVSSAGIKYTVSSVSSAIARATATGLGETVKKFLFRAAGEEGLAENVGVQSQVINPHPAHASDTARTSYSTSTQTVSCIDTSGQTFAIWLNFAYLLPLMALFMRFYIKAYLRRSGPAGSAKDAAKGVSREIEKDKPTKSNGQANGHANGHANGNATPNGKAKTNGKARN